MTEPVNLAAVLSTFTDLWSPRTVATLNDYDVRVVKTHGEFTRHSHPETDEVFLVLVDTLAIRLDDGEVTLGPGQLYVVPRGVHHQPVSTDGAEVLLIETPCQREHRGQPQRADGSPPVGLSFDPARRVPAGVRLPT